MRGHHSTNPKKGSQGNNCHLPSKKKGEFKVDERQNSGRRFCLKQWNGKMWCNFSTMWHKEHKQNTKDNVCRMYITTFQSCAWWAYHEKTSRGNPERPWRGNYIPCPEKHQKLSFIWLLLYIMCIRLLYFVDDRFRVDQQNTGIYENFNPASVESTDPRAHGPTTDTPERGPSPLKSGCQKFSCEGIHQNAKSWELTFSVIPSLIQIWLQNICAYIYSIL